MSGDSKNDGLPTLDEWYGTARDRFESPAPPFNFLGDGWNNGSGDVFKPEYYTDTLKTPLIQPPPAGTPLLAEINHDAALIDKMREHYKNVHFTGFTDQLVELGERHNANKERYDLLPAAALHELVLVLTYGAKKYAPRNWQKGLSWCDTFASMLRHAYAWMRGETHDAESGCHHMAHVAFGALALVEFAHTRKGVDDRVRYDDGREVQTLPTGCGGN
jgi:hypothetical protein